MKLLAIARLTGNARALELVFDSVPTDAQIADVHDIVDFYISDVPQIREDKHPVYRMGNDGLVRCQDCGSLPGELHNDGCKFAGRPL